MIYQVNMNELTQEIFMDFLEKKSGKDVRRKKKKYIISWVGRQFLWIIVRLVSNLPQINSEVSYELNDVSIKNQILIKTVLQLRAFSYNGSNKLDSRTL